MSRALTLVFVFISLTVLAGGIAIAFTKAHEAGKAAIRDDFLHAARSYQGIVQTVLDSRAQEVRYLAKTFPTATGQTSSIVAEHLASFLNTHRGGIGFRGDLKFSAETVHPWFKQNLADMPNIFETEFVDIDGRLLWLCETRDSVRTDATASEICHHGMGEPIGTTGVVPPTVKTELEYGWFSKLVTSVAATSTGSTTAEQQATPEVFTGTIHLEYNRHKKTELEHPLQPAISFSAPVDISSNFDPNVASAADSLGFRQAQKNTPFIGYVTIHDTLTQILNPARVLSKHYNDKLFIVDDRGSFILRGNRGQQEWTLDKAIEVKTKSVYTLMSAEGTTPAYMLLNKKDDRKTNPGGVIEVPYISGKTKGRQNYFAYYTIPLVTSVGGSADTTRVHIGLEFDSLDALNAAKVTLALGLVTTFMVLALIFAIAMQLRYVVFPPEMSSLPEPTEFGDGDQDEEMEDKDDGSEDDEDEEVEEGSEDDY